MSIEQNIAAREAAESLAHDLAAFVTAEISGLENVGAFWRKFDQLTRPVSEPAEPVSVPGRTAFTNTGLDEVDDLVDEIVELAEEIPEKGRDFANSVLERAESIAATIDQTGTASERQLAALENMRDGLAKWRRD